MFAPGDAVTYPAGRGRSAGKILEIIGGLALIETSAGKRLYRKLEHLTHVEQPSPEDAPPTCADDTCGPVS